MNKLFSTIMSVASHAMCRQLTCLKRVQDIALRAPSVPLITSDTYLAIWSPYNELNEGNTEHWTSRHPSFTGSAPGGRESISFHGQGQAKPRNNPSDDKHRTLGSKVHHEPTGGQLDTAPVR
nr:DUF4964 domain-containing protein [Bacteroides thetaiotaomicron]